MTGKPDNNYCSALSAQRRRRRRCCYCFCYCCPDHRERHFHPNGSPSFVVFQTPAADGRSEMNDAPMASSTSTRSKRRSRVATSRTVTLQMLLDTNILEPGDSVLSLEYMVNTSYFVCVLTTLDNTIGYIRSAFGV